MKSERRDEKEERRRIDVELHKVSCAQISEEQREDRRLKDRVLQAKQIECSFKKM